MDPLELARWQFGVITVYHFLFVPLTISLSFLVAGLQTAWVRTGDERWLRLTKFYGKLFLINFAMGVVTGIVQEFQFGMNWSDYSRFVGDIFGAPLAIEGLVAFFLESTFLGLWIFGWDRLPRRVHLATIWLAATGTLLSAYFILAANSWMQNPVGYRFNPDSARAELTDFGAVLLNKVTLVAVPHTIAAAFVTGGAFVLGVALWRLSRRPGRDREAFTSAGRYGAVVLLVASLGVVVTGDLQGKVMTEVQPMKMAAAEALYETSRPADFSLFTIGSLDGSREVFAVTVPGVTSFLATGSFDGEVQGIDDLQDAYEALYGPGSYAPNIPVTYWSFRLMMGFGLLAAGVGLWALWALRDPRRTASPWVARVAVVLPLLPLLANTLGWVFTEMGRQPWAVFGLMRTSAGVSPGTSTGEVLASFAGLSLVYGVLAVIEVGLLVTFVKAGLPEVPAQDASGAGDDEPRPMSFAY